MNRVVVTGLGCITPIGNYRRRLPIRPSSPATTGIAPFPTLPRSARRRQGLRFTQSGRSKTSTRQHLATPASVATDRTTHFAIVAARQAATHSNLLTAPRSGKHRHHRRLRLRRPQRRRDRDRSPLHPQRPRPSPHRHPHHGLRRASHISIDLGITGPVLNISTACASATHAIGLAFHMVRAGIVSAAITGGHEAPLTFGFLRAWDTMRVVSPTHCRPFSADRDGMTLGEGAAMLAIETLDSAQARNAPIYAEIVGFGMSADASHITQPLAEGAAAAMRRALKDAEAATNDSLSLLIRRLHQRPRHRHPGQRLRRSRRHPPRLRPPRPAHPRQLHQGPPRPLHRSHRRPRSPRHRPRPPRRPAPRHRRRHHPGPRPQPRPHPQRPPHPAFLLHPATRPLPLTRLRRPQRRARLPPLLVPPSASFHGVHAALDGKFLACGMHIPADKVNG